MDVNLIYRKTALGEDAMQNRSRLTQRELRTVLILVDGKSSVAELCEKTGNPKVVQSGLDQLEQGGFIESIAGHASESEIDKSTAQMAEIFSKAVGQTIELPPMPDDPEFQKPGAGKRAQGRSAASAASRGRAGSETVRQDSRPESRTSEGSGEIKRQEPHLGEDHAAEAPPELTDVVKPLTGVAPPVVHAIEPLKSVATASPAAVTAAVAAPAEPEAPEAPAARKVNPAPVTEPPAGDAEEKHGPASIADLSASLNAELGKAKHDTAVPAAETPDASDTTRSITPSAAANPFVVPEATTEPATLPRRGASEQRAVEEPAQVVPLFPRRKLKLGKGVIFGAIGALLLLAVIGIAAFPVGSYRGQMEAALGRSIGQPVTIGAVHSSLNPLPVIVLENVKIGTSGDLTIREVRATPQPFSLFSQRKVFSNVDVSAVSVPVERLGMLAAAVNGIGAGGDNLIVRRLRLDSITFAIRDLVVQQFSGLAEMDAEGKLKKFDLGKADGTMRIGLQGQGEGASVTIEGNNWKPADGSPYVFDALLIQGTLAGSHFTADKIEGRLLGGVMNGRLDFDWSNEMALEGLVGSDFMPTRSFLTALGSPLQVDGEINGRLRFKASAPSWAGLVEHFPIEGDFVAKKGTVTGMDLVEAVRRAGKVAYRGGLTKFEQITGRFNFDGQTLQLSAIDLSSGVVHAAGRLAIGKGQQLNGNLDVLLRGTAVGTRMPVAVSGNLKNPVLTAGRR